MGGIGVMLRFEKEPADPSRYEELHRALWDCVDARLKVALKSKLTDAVRVHYLSDQRYNWYDDERRDPLSFMGVTFSFFDGGDDFPMKYMSHHWVERVCCDPLVFAQMQAVAKRFGAALQPRLWHPPETIYFPLAGGDALAGIHDDYLDIWTEKGLVRVDFAECPILHYVHELVESKRCLCEVCRPTTDSDPGPRFDPEFLAGIPWFVEEPSAPETFARIGAASEDEDLEFPVEEIAALTGIARRKAELLLAMTLDQVNEDARVPAALLKLGARWAAPVLFAHRIDKSASYEWRNTLSETLKALLKKPPIRTTGELVDADGVPILVLTFVGDYVDESDAKTMRADTDALLVAHPTAQGIVLDASELSYTTGKGLVGIVDSRRPRWWVMSPLSRGLHDFTEKERKVLAAEWLASSREAAITALRARVVADVYEIHNADGTLAETVRREPRGRRHHLRLDENGTEVDAELLYTFVGGYVELVKRYKNGVVRVEELPVLDAQGNENDAGRVGGKVYRFNGELYKVDFNRNASGQSVPPDWVDRVAAFPTIRHVSLDNTNVPTAEILQLLERCPQLVGLYLNRCKVDAELFTSPLLRNLHRLQLHDAEVPPLAIAQLAALHPWIDIQPPPPQFETHARQVDADGVAILVVSFAGFSDAEATAKMKSAIEAALAQHPDVKGIVLDATRLSIAAGKETDMVLAEGRPFAWAVSASSRGLFRYFRVERDLEVRAWLFPSVDAAIAAVRALVVADSYEVLSANGNTRWTRWKREQRGLRRFSWRSVEGHHWFYETLFDARGRVIEELYHRDDDAEKGRSEFPIPDDAGGESEACRLGAKLVFEKGTLVTIEYSVKLTNLPLPADWVDRIALHYQTVTCLNLDGTGAKTADLVKALERCPKIDRLWLNSLTLDAEFFAAPQLANVKILWIWGTTVPPGAVKALAAKHPSIDINPREALQ